ncbi:hypothetical protein BDZ94DRAFT_1208576 [Collybia nuda]|uniref:F-box domain-containing protein n=1 Tax=Collybia nuda TaxID=64659 RepID=A0A9P5YEH3_9AGAR|nr:hypothetical protein BDZ94DRAFT_1208576 [Collybia nuda]
MTWKASFNQGIKSFRDSRYEDALWHFTEARGDQQYTVYDSRAATYEKLGKLKEALQDTKKAIGLAPDRWQSYTRAARLFLSVQKHDASSTMASMALDRIKAGDTTRHAELLKLRDDINEAQRVADNFRKTTIKDARKNAVAGSQQYAQYNFGKLPTELVGEIFSLIVDESPETLLVLLRVCQHWRTTIWHTPSLWATLILTHRNPNKKATQWVDRSNGHIRELRVRAPAVEHRHWPCNALARVRWDRLRVCSVETWDIAKYLEDMSLKHILGHLTILAVDNYAVVPRSLRSTLFVESPMVRSLTMVHTNFSWNELTEYFHKLLVVDTQSFSLPSLDAVVELPNLVHLELAGAGLLNITNRLALPKLQKLRLCRGSLVLDTVLHNIRPARLLELSIIQSLVSPSCLIDFLRKATSLERLELSHLSGTTNEVVEALSAPFRYSSSTRNVAESSATAGLMCPLLAHINVSYSPDIQTGPLVRLIRSRLPQPDSQAAELSPTVSDQKLLSLQADGCELIDPEWIPWFRNNLQKFSCIYKTKKSASWKR